MDPFVGQIQPFGFNFPPQGWATCSGQLLAISQNTALFSLLGTTFGGDGRTTFGLPDLRGRSIVGIGNGPGLDSISWGQKSGSYLTTLTTNNMPSHNHSVAIGVNNETGEEPNATSILSNHPGAFTEEAAAGLTLGGVTQNNVGSGQSFNIRNPYLGINVCIAMLGIYPSRS